MLSLRWPDDAVNPRIGSSVDDTTNDQLQMNTFWKQKKNYSLVKRFFLSLLGYILADDL